jgi:hypothetical protein
VFFLLSCPNIHELRLAKISNLSEIGLENGLSKLKNLAILRILLLKDPFVLYSFILKVPEFILPKIKVLEITINKRSYNRKNVSSSISFWIPSTDGIYYYSI